MHFDISFVRSVLPALALVTTAVPQTGCFGSGSSSSAAVGDEGSDPDPDPDQPTEPDQGLNDPHNGDTVDDQPLARCAEGLSREEIADNVAITFDFEISAHEMIACGGLVFGIVFALVEGLAEMVEDPSSSTLPDQYTFDGEGTYFVEPATFNDLRMEVRFYLGRDYSFGSKGELVTQNLFLMSNYLVDAKAEVTVDTSGGWPEVSIEIEHAGPGPMAELLGLGADPPSPLVVTQDTLANAEAHLRDMEVEAIIFFADHPGVSTIEYDVQSPRMLADSFLWGLPMNLAMVGADGWRADTEQDLDVDVWTVEYADGGVGALDGDIEFTTRGGLFDYVSRLHYDGTGWPTIELACAD